MEVFKLETIELFSFVGHLIAKTFYLRDYFQFAHEDLKVKNTIQILMNQTFTFAA